MLVIQMDIDIFSKNVIPRSKRRGIEPSLGLNKKPQKES